LLALGEVFIRRGEQNIAAGAAVTVSDAYNNPPAWQPANTTDGQTILGAPVIPVASRRNGWHAQFAKSLDEPKWVQVDLGTELPLDEVRIFPAHPRDFPTRPGFGFPMRFRVEADNDPAFSQPTVLIDHTASDFANPADNPVSMPTRGTTARYVRMTATRLWARSDDFIFALAEMQVWSNGRNVALGQAVTALDSIEISAWSRRLLVDDFNSQGRIVKFTDWLRDLSRRREISIALTQVRRQRERVASDLIVNATRLMVILSLVAGVVCLVSWSRRRRLRRREFNVLRERIAGDLHDEIGSNIGSIVLLSQMALKQPADAPNDLAEINRVARETAASLRDLVWFIQPAASSAGDFAAKLRETAATLLAGVEWTFEGEAPAGTLSLEFKRQLFLILKEALHNVRRHAGASLVQIRLDERAGVFRLEISDDGRGFDVAQNSSGHGLTSLRQRAAALGGTLVLDSTPGSGTRLVLEVKLTSRLRTMSP
jgi:signal transduction histidine kinase